MRTECEFEPIGTDKVRTQCALAQVAECAIIEDGYVPVVPPLFTRASLSKLRLSNVYLSTSVLTLTVYTFSEVYERLYGYRRRESRLRTALLTRLCLPDKDSGIIL